MNGTEQILLKELKKRVDDEGVVPLADFHDRARQIIAKLETLGEIEIFKKHNQDFARIKP